VETGDGETEAGVQPEGVLPADHPEAGAGEHREDGPRDPGCLVQGLHRLESYMGKSELVHTG
jgi:hypothetical protein